MLKACILGDLLLIPKDAGLDHFFFRGRGIRIDEGTDRSSHPFQLLPEGISISLPDNDDACVVGNGTTEKNTLKSQVAFIVKSSGIMEISPFAQPRSDADDIPVIAS